MNPCILDPRAPRRQRQLKLRPHSTPSQTGDEFVCPPTEFQILTAASGVGIPEGHTITLYIVMAHGTFTTTGSYNLDRVGLRAECTASSTSLSPLNVLCSWTDIHFYCATRLGLSTPVH